MEFLSLSRSSKAGPKCRLLTRDYFTWLRGMIMIFIDNDDDDDNDIEMTEYNY